MAKQPAVRRSRFHDLAQTLTAEIGRGVYPVGGTIPTEMELCAQFGASRHTVRAAVDRLVRSGMVTRRPRIGTVVKRQQPLPETYKMTVGGVTDLLQFAASTRMRVLKRELRTVTDQDEALAPHVGEQWLFVEGLRTAEGAEKPICFNELWIHPDFRAVSGVEGDVEASVFDLIAKEFDVDIKQVTQEVHAAPLPDYLAQALQLPAGSAGLWVRRQYFDDVGRLIESALSVHPPETFRFRLTLDRSA
jgi:GntR family transcriptional regulator